MGVLFLAKLGAGSAHTISYLFIMWSFDSSKVSFVFATCNLVSRLIAGMAPLISELD